MEHPLYTHIVHLLQHNFCKLCTSRLQATPISYVIACAPTLHMPIATHVKQEAFANEALASAPPLLPKPGKTCNLQYHSRTNCTLKHAHRPQHQTARNSWTSSGRQYPKMSVLAYQALNSCFECRSGCSRCTPTTCQTTHSVSIASDQNYHSAVDKLLRSSASSCPLGNLFRAYYVQCTTCTGN